MKRYKTTFEIYTEAAWLGIAMLVVMLSVLYATLGTQGLVLAILGGGQ